MDVRDLSGEISSNRLPRKVTVSVTIVMTVSSNRDE